MSLVRQGLVLSCILAASVSYGASAAPSLDQVIAGSQRSDAAKVRDKYRHPKETLAFFDIKPDATVIEISPGGGYWTEILGPYLNDKGKYVAAVSSYGSGVKGFTDKFGGKENVFGKIEVVPMDFSPGVKLAPDGSADFVLTFRNVHNWMAAGNVDAAFSSFYNVLKPGGILALKEHRADEKSAHDPKAKNGYVRQQHVIDLAKKAGFEFVAGSEVNANPKDTKNHPEGVWTLPPTLRLGDKDKAKYLEIGESDRMTLKFKKPAAPSK